MKKPKDEKEKLPREYKLLNSTFKKPTLQFHAQSTTLRVFLLVYISTALDMTSYYKRTRLLIQISLLNKKSL